MADNSEPVFKPIGDEVEQIDTREDSRLTELDSVCAECRKEVNK